MHAKCMSLTPNVRELVAYKYLEICIDRNMYLGYALTENMHLVSEKM